MQRSTRRALNENSFGSDNGLPDRHKFNLNSIDAITVWLGVK